MLDVAPSAYAAAPHLLLPAAGQRASAASVVHAVALRCQLRIEPQRRPYDAAEQDGLTDLFGTSER